MNQTKSRRCLLTHDRVVDSGLESVDLLTYLQPNSGVHPFVIGKRVATISNSRACSLRWKKWNAVQGAYAVEDCALGRYDVANGWLAFGSDVSGSISSMVITSHCISLTSWITSKVPINVGVIAQSLIDYIYCSQLNLLCTPHAKQMNVYSNSVPAVVLRLSARGTESARPCIEPSCVSRYTSLTLQKLHTFIFNAQLFISK